MPLQIPSPAALSLLINPAIPHAILHRTTRHTGLPGATTAAPQASNACLPLVGAGFEVLSLLADVPSRTTVPVGEPPHVSVPRPSQQHEVENLREKSNRRPRAAAMPAAIRPKALMLRWSHRVEGFQPP